MFIFILQWACVNYYHPPTNFQQGEHNYSITGLDEKLLFNKNIENLTVHDNRG